MTNTKKLYENFSKFLEREKTTIENPIVVAWKQKLYDWVKDNAKREDKDALAAALHEVADEMAVMQEEINQDD